MGKTGMSCQQKLEQRAEREISIHGNPYRAAEYWAVSSAHFHNVLNEGMDSPTLRRKWGINKTNRCRLGLDVTEELRAEFHRQRGDMTGGEYLAVLMENANVD